MAINDPTPFTLTEGEKSSPLWRRLEEHLKEKLAECRAKNDGALGPIQTANIRGQIQTYRDILLLGQD